MAKKKAETKQAIKQVASGGITKKELEQVAKQTGATTQQLVQQMDIINKNAKQAGKEPSISLNSGAANMLIKQMEKATPQMLGYQQPDFGGGRIAKTLQGMMGSRASGGYINPRSGQQSFTAAVPSQMMIGGTQIRPGGRVAVRPMGAAPSVGGAATDVTESGTAGDNIAGGGDQFDYQAMLDELMGMMPDYQSMFADFQDQMLAQFEPLTSQYDTPDPLQLASLGQSYGGDLIRARQRQGKKRSDYFRNRMNNMSIDGNNRRARLALGGGVTI